MEAQVNLNYITTKSPLLFPCVYVQDSGNGTMGVRKIIRHLDKKGDMKAQPKC